MSDSSLFKIIPQLGHGTFRAVAAAVLHKEEEYLLASLDENGTLIIWDILSGKQVFEYDFREEKPSKLRLTEDHLYAYGGYALYKWERDKVPDVRKKAEAEINEQIEKIRLFPDGNREQQRPAGLPAGNLSSNCAHYSYLEYGADEAGNAALRLVSVVSLEMEKEGSPFLLGSIEKEQLSRIGPKNDFFIRSHVYNSAHQFLALLLEYPDPQNPNGGDSVLALFSLVDGAFELIGHNSITPLSGLSRSGEYAYSYDHGRLVQLNFLTEDTIPSIGKAEHLGFRVHSGNRIESPFSILDAGHLRHKEQDAWNGRHYALSYKTSLGHGIELYNCDSITIAHSDEGLYQSRGDGEAVHQCLAVSAPDLKYFVSTPSAPGPIYLWNVERVFGQLERKFHAGRPEIINMIKQDNDEANLVFRNNSVFSLSFHQGIVLKKKLESNERVSKVAISRQGDKIAFVKAGGLHLESTAPNGQLTSLSFSLASARLREMAFSPDGQFLALALEEEIAVLETGFLQEIARWNFPGARHLAFQPVANRLAAVYSDDSHKAHVTLFNWKEQQGEERPPQAWNFCFTDESLNEPDKQPPGNFVPPTHSTYTVIPRLAQEEPPGSHAGTPSAHLPAPVEESIPAIPYPRFDKSGKLLILRGNNKVEILEFESLESSGLKSRQPGPASASENLLPPIAFPPVRGPILFGPRDEFMLLKNPDNHALEIWKKENLFKLLDEYRYNRSKLEPEEKPVSFIPPFQDAMVMPLDNLPIILLARKNEECIKLYRWDTGNFIGTFFPVNEKKFLLIDELGNYYSTSEGYGLTAFLHKQKVYPIDQFDLLFNRPHRILEKLGNVDEQLLRIYENAYLKRLNRALGKNVGNLEATLPISIEQLLAGEPLPQAHIIEKYGILGSTYEPELEFVAYAAKRKDDKKLQRLAVYVNNVPICGKRAWLGKKNKEIEAIKEAFISDFDFEEKARALQGSKGLSLEPPHNEELAAKIKLVLSSGLNKIDVSVLNEQGVEWIRDTFYVNYTPNPNVDHPKPRLYLIGIGVSGHKDKSLDLNFPALNILKFIRLFLRPDVEKEYEVHQVLTFTTVKEIREEDKNREEEYRALLEELAEAHESYKHLEKVERDEILSIKEKVLSHTREDDRVIIFFSGHGETDENNDLILDTFPLDIRNLRETGIAYEEMEGLLDDIPARHKLLLLDTCFSGEIDKEAADATDLDVAGQLNKAFERMQDAFFDARRGTGATVIASSGGTELAKEHEDWQGSVFTFCLLKALRENQQLTVSELQDLLAREVPREARDKIDSKQTPDFRVRNIGNDWEVW